MPGDTQNTQISMQEVNARRQREAFVGREGQISFVREQLTLEPEDYRRRFIISVFGQGGVGKTWLLKEVERYARDSDFAVTRSDEAQKSVLAVMGRMADQLTGQGGDFEPFIKRYRTYLREKDQLENDPETPQGLIELLAGSTAIGVMELGKMAFPPSKIILDMVETPVAAQAGQWAEWLRKKVSNDDEIELVLKPVSVLTPLFVSCLNRVAGEKRVVCMFDTFERTSAFLESWLRELFLGEYGSLSSNLTFVLSGRQEVDRGKWTDFEGIVARLPLDPFTESEALTYLNRQKVYDEALTSTMLQLSGRLPLLLATLASQHPRSLDQIEDVTGTAVERFLQWIDTPGRRKVAILGALPRVLDDDVIQLLAQQEGDPAVEWLKELPFVERRTANAGWTYHDLVRFQMLRYFRQSSPGSWSEWHRKLEHHYLQIIESTGLSGKDAHRSTRWLQNHMARCYHRLCASPESELIWGLTALLTSLDVRFSAASQIAEIMEQSGTDSDSLLILSWSRLVREGLTGYLEGEYTKSLELFDALLDPEVSLSNEARQIALSWRSRVHVMNSEYRLALIDLDSLAAMGNDNPELLFRKAEMHRLMGNYDLALIEIDRAVELEPENPIWVAHRAGFFSHIGEAQKALAELDRAHAMDPQDSWLLARRAKLHTSMRQFDAAIEDYDQLIQRDPTDPWWLYSRAQVFATCGNFSRATEDYDRVVTIHPEGSGWRFQRAVFLRSLGKLQEALEDLSVALAIDPDYIQAFMVQGQILLQQGSPKLALDSFEAIIARNSNYDWAHAYRGLALQLLERYEAALSCFDRALELDGRNEFTQGLRGGVLIRLGRIQEAIAVYDKVLAMDKAQDWWLYKRGLAHRLDGNESTASTDLNTALSLAQSQRDLLPAARWYNEFNIPLYLVASGQAEPAFEAYVALLDQDPPAWALEVGLDDLRGYLSLFPEDRLADGVLARFEGLVKARSVERRHSS